MPQEIEVFACSKDSSYPRNSRRSSIDIESGRSASLAAVTIPSSFSHDKDPKSIFSFSSARTKDVSYSRSSRWIHSSSQSNTSSLPHTATDGFFHVDEKMTRLLGGMQYWAIVCGVITTAIAILGFFALSEASLCIPILLIIGSILTFSVFLGAKLRRRWVALASGIQALMLILLLLASTAYHIYVLSMGVTASVQNIIDFAKGMDYQHPPWAAKPRDGGLNVGQALQQLQISYTDVVKDLKLSGEWQTLPPFFDRRYLSFTGSGRLMLKFREKHLGCILSHANIGQFKMWPVDCAKECGLIFAKAEERREVWENLSPSKQFICAYYDLYSSSSFLRNAHYVSWIILLVFVILLSAAAGCILYPFLAIYSLRAYAEKRFLQ